MKIWVTNWQPYSIPHSAMKCIQWTPDDDPPAVLWFIIGCKGNHFFRKNQIYSHLFHQSLLNALELIVASFVAPARKVRIRFYVLLPNDSVVSRFFLSYNILFTWVTTLATYSFITYNIDSLSHLTFTSSQCLASAAIDIEWHFSAPSVRIFLKTCK